MDKIREKLLEKFKRSSIPEREKMAKKWGFDTVDAYFNDLVGVIHEVKKEPKTSNVPTDIVFAFDTTGSMNSYIEAVKAHVKETIPTLFKNTPDLRIKVVAFGDYCDIPRQTWSASSTVYGKAYQQSQLTDNANELIDFINKVENTSGGDSDEFYELVIKKIVEETPWRKDAKKAIMLIADYTPHPLGYTLEPWIRNNQIDWRVEANKAKEVGIQIDTFKIIPQHSWYDELSKITGGVCLDFKTSSKMANVMAAASYSRGSTESFMSFAAETRASGDEELIGVVKSYEARL